MKCLRLEGAHEKRASPASDAMASAAVLASKGSPTPTVWRMSSSTWAHGVVVSHPLSMREALGSIPSVSIGPSQWLSLAIVGVALFTIANAGIESCAHVTPTCRPRPPLARNSFNKRDATKQRSYSGCCGQGARASRNRIGYVSTCGALRAALRRMARARPRIPRVRDHHGEPPPPPAPLAIA